MELVKHETCLQYFHRRLSEGWKCISLEGYNAVLLSPEGIRREIDLRNDILTLRPNEPGVSTQLYKGGSSPAPTNWEGVDEETPDEDVTYNYNNAGPTPTTGKDLYNLPNHTTESGPINSVKVYHRC
ncbi:unnamed protein product, partial [marine sediment metagenome]